MLGNSITNINLIASHMNTENDARGERLIKRHSTQQSTYVFILFPFKFYDSSDIEFYTVMKIYKKFE